MIGLIIPPADIKKLLQKTAEHVALNGSEFERILIQREQYKPQFAFLKPESPYRAYYDHRVAQFSKKLIQGLNNDQPKQQQKQGAPQVSIIKQQQPQREQKSFLENIFIQLKQPDPDKYITELPEKLSEGEQAIIQHTAQYAAKNGKNFLVALSQREKNNPQFQFLRTSSKNHIYFMKNVQAYTNILQMRNEQLERLAKYLQTKEQIFNKCRQVYEYHLQKQQQAKGKRQNQSKQPKQNNIDWNDFQLVQTIVFESQNNQKNSSDFINKIVNHNSTLPKSMEEKIISQPKKRQILQQCHACRQHILASEMNKHLKTCIGLKKKDRNNELQQNIGQDVDIRKNLQSLSMKRPDIFGTQQNKIVRQEQQGEKSQLEQTFYFDGQAPNLTRTTGSMALLNYQQKKIKQEVNKQKNKK